MLVFSSPSQPLHLIANIRSFSNSCNRLVTLPVKYSCWSTNDSFVNIHRSVVTFLRIIAMLFFTFKQRTFAGEKTLYRRHYYSTLVRRYGSRYVLKRLVHFIIRRVNKRAGIVKVRRWTLRANENNTVVRFLLDDVNTNRIC